MTKKSYLYLIKHGPISEALGCFRAFCPPKHYGLMIPLTIITSCPFSVADLLKITQLLRCSTLTFLTCKIRSPKKIHCNFTGCLTTWDSSNLHLLKTGLGYSALWTEIYLEMASTSDKIRCLSHFKYRLTISDSVCRSPRLVFGFPAFSRIFSVL